MEVIRALIPKLGFLGELSAWPFSILLGTFILKGRLR
jgi:hypothetical protein